MWSDWLVFCDCGFQSVCPLMEMDKRLMEASWWDRLTEGDTGSCSMGGVMLSKSLIHFSVDGWSCVPSLLFTWDQTMVEVLKIMVTSLKRSHACTAVQSMPPTLQQATLDPPLHQRLPDTTDFWKSESESCSAMSNSLWLHGYTVPEILQARILEWVAFPFSRGSSQPRDWTQVSRIAGRFFTSWANRDAQQYWSG